MVLSYVLSLSYVPASFSISHPHQLVHQLPHQLVKLVHSLLNLPLFPTRTHIFAAAKGAKASLPNLLLSTGKGLQVKTCSK